MNGDLDKVVDAMSATVTEAQLSSAIGQGSGVI